MDEPINIMLSEIRQLSKTNALWFHLHKVSEIVKVKATRYNMVVAPVSMERQMGSHSLTGQTFSLARWKSSWDLLGSIVPMVNDNINFKFVDRVDLILPVLLCCSVAQLCPTLWNAIVCGKPGFPVLHHLQELAQTRVHWVGDAIQPSHPLSPPSDLS